MTVYPTTKELDTGHYMGIDASSDKGITDGHNGPSAEQAIMLEESASSSRPLSGIKNVLYSVLSVLSVLLILIPRRGRPANPKALHQLHPMAYLDALRGYFAIQIYIRHFVPSQWRWLPYWIQKTPILQFPTQGSNSSLIGFFFISGYAGTYKAVGLMQSRQFEKLLDVLASTVWRRFMRLFLPVLGTTFVTLILIKMHIILVPGYKVKLVTGNFLSVFLRDSLGAVNIFMHATGWRVEPDGGQILDHFWFMRTEFRGSMMASLVCLGTCKLSVGSRKRFYWVGIFFAIYSQASYVAMTLLGMWFGERRRERESQQLREQTLPSRADSVTAIREQSTSAENPIDQDHASKTYLIQGKLSSYASAGYNQLGSSVTVLRNRAQLPSRFRQPLLIAMFLYSFILHYEPFSNQTSPHFPYSAIRMITPRHWDGRMKVWFQLMIGFLMSLYPLDLLPVLQKPLLMPFSQYLGELSFGIYAVQYTVGWPIWPRYLNFIRTKTSYGPENFDSFVPIFPGLLFMTIVLLWVADVFRRFDMWVVKLCIRAEKRFFVSK